MQNIATSSGTIFSIDESGNAVIGIGDNYESRFYIRDVHFEIQTKDDGRIFFIFKCGSDLNCIVRHYGKGYDNPHNAGDSSWPLTIISVKEGEKMIEGLKYLQGFYSRKEDLFDGN